jgi:hypothetical protein
VCWSRVSHRRTRRRPTDPGSQRCASRMAGSGNRRLVPCDEQVRRVNTRWPSTLRRSGHHLARRDNAEGHRVDIRHRERNAPSENGSDEGAIQSCGANERAAKTMSRSKLPNE